MNSVGLYVLSVASRGQGPPCVDRGPKSAASYFGWALMDQRPDLSDGGLNSPYTEDGMIRFEPVRSSPACTAVTLGDARNVSASEPQEIVMKLLTNLSACSPT